MSAELSKEPSEKSLALPNGSPDMVEINIDHIEKIQIDEFLNWLKSPQKVHTGDYDLKETTAKSIESNVINGPDKARHSNEFESLEKKRSAKSQREGKFRNGKYEKSGRSSVSRIFGKSGGSGKSG